MATIKVSDMGNTRLPLKGTELINVIQDQSATATPLLVSTKLLLQDAVGSPYGSIIASIVATDHSGYVLLDGRLVSLLTPSQQVVCANLGLTTYIPNTGDSVLMKNSQPLGTQSGSNERTIAKANLPSYNLTVSTTGSHNHGITGDGTATTSEDGGHYHLQSYQAAAGDTEMYGTGGSSVWNTSKFNADSTSSGNTAPKTSGVNGATGNGLNHSHTVNFNLSSNATGDHTHTVGSGGSGTALDITPKALSVNFFIYLGA